MGTKLNVTEASKLLAMRSGKSIAQICREIGCGTPSNLQQMINNESIRTRVSSAMANACGYKLCFVPDDVEIDDMIEIEGKV